MSIIGKHGVDENTPKNIPFGSGTYHRGLKWENGAWTGTCIGATSGGGKLSIEGELKDLDIDGAMVLFKGQTVKTGGKASMEVNMAVLSGDNIKMVTHFKEGESDADGYTMFVDKPNIEAGDYQDNFGFVGKTLDGRNIVVIFDSALCKSAFEYEGKNKENSVFKATMEAYAEIDSNLDTIPVRIYWPDLPVA